MNPQELVTLTNKKTNQIKQVPRSQLSQYGLPSDYVSQSDNYAKAIISGNAAVTDVPQEYKGAVLQVLGQNGYSPKKNDTQSQLKLAQMGALPESTYGDLAKNNPQAALALSMGGYKPPMSAADKKTQDSTKGLLGLTDQLKTLYNEPLANGQRPNSSNKESLAKGGEGFMSGINGALFDLTQVATNKNADAKSYKRAKEGFTSSLKSLTGDTGVLTDQDYARLAKLLPDFGDSDTTAKSAWANIDNILKSKLGSAGQFDYSTQQTPSGLQSPQAGMNASQFPAASVQGAPQQGLAFLMAQQRAQQAQSQPQVQGAQTQQPQSPQGQAPQLNGFEQGLMNTGIPDTVHQIMSVVNPSIDKVATNLGQGQQVSGGDVLGAGGEVAADILPWLRGLGGAGLAARATGNIARNALGGAIKGATAPDQTGGERATNALTQGLQGGALAGAFNVAGKVMHPFQTVGEMKQAAVANAAGKTVSGFKILSALQNGAEGLSPTVKKGYLNFLSQATGDFADKQLPIETAVKLATSANDAYSAAGKVGKAASAKFNDVLAKAIKGEIQTVAPKITQANKMFSQLYGLKNNIAKPVASTAIGAGAGAAIYGLLSRLGIGQGQ